MVSLEIKKIKRKKFLIALFLVCVAATIIQYMMGNVTYNGIKYGAEVGWFLNNGLTVNSYYMFIPIFSLTGMELFLIEEKNNTLNNLLSIPIRKIDLVKSKIIVLFIISMAYTLVTFSLMIVLELSLNIDSITINIILGYIVKYLIHAVISFLTSAFVVGMMLYLKQSMQVAVIIGFVISFLGIFISQTNCAYVYVVNAMFYISNEVNSTIFEKLVSITVVLFVSACALFFYKKYAQRDC